MENPNLVNQLQNLKLPNLGNSIDYCALHNTTNDENYRKLAVEGLRNYERAVKTYNLVVPQLIDEIYPVFLEKIGGNGDLDGEELAFKKTMDNFVEKLRTPFDTEGINDFMDYCVSCKNPSKMKCPYKRNELIAIQEVNEAKLKGLIGDVIGLVKLVTSHASPAPSSSLEGLLKRKDFHLRQ